MHARLIDIARYGACDVSEPRDDRRKVSALWWCVPCFAAWCAFIWWVLA